MLKKLTLLTLAHLILVSTALTGATPAQHKNAQAVAANQTNNERGTPSQSQSHSTASEKDRIMLRDQIDNTDTYAIPLDDSEIEDEEEINRLEQRKVFPLPTSR